MYSNYPFKSVFILLLYIFSSFIVVYYTFSSYCDIIINNVTSQYACQRTNKVVFYVRNICSFLLPTIRKDLCVNSHDLFQPFLFTQRSLHPLRNKCTPYAPFMPSQITRFYVPEIYARMISTPKSAIRSNCSLFSSVLIVTKTSISRKSQKT